MIVKVKSHKRAAFSGVLKYILENKERLRDPKGKSFLLKHNLKGKKIEDWVKQYKANEAFRNIHRKGNVMLTHEILSWHKDDAENITPEKLEKIAEEYINRRNPNGMYIATAHFDKEHYHIHVCASGLEYRTGKSLRMSRQEFSDLKKGIQEFQQEKFPELSKSVVSHGKGDLSRMSDAEYQVKRRTGRETGREKVTAALKTCYKKAESKETFLELLHDCGLKTYERSGKITGVIDNGIKFRFSRLGFTEERLADLDKTKLRGKELRGVRGKDERNNKAIEMEKTEKREVADEEMKNAESKNEEQEMEKTDEVSKTENAPDESNEKESQEDEREAELDEARSGRDDSSGRDITDSDDEEDDDE